jgi:hypothetical protein
MIRRFVRAVIHNATVTHAEAGWPVAVHAIGDAANRAALDSFEATRDAWEPAGLRPRIEHAQLLDDADVARFAEIGVTASVQFSHAPSDRDLAERLWEGKQGAYAYRSLLDAGALLANGSDAPVEELDPLAGIVAGVLRTIRKTDLLGGFSRLRAYYERCFARPAWQRTLQMYADRFGMSVEELR